MKTIAWFFMLIGLLIPIQPARAQTETETVITLTAEQVDDAQDIEFAINEATAHGARPGSVILDGRDGPFVFSGEDRSLNLFVSNLVLRGIHGATIENCDDGLFFDDLGIRNIRVEGIAFYCSGGGVEAGGNFQDVTLHDNLFSAGTVGISLGGPSGGWRISANLIQAASDAIRMTGVERVLISGNHLSGGGSGIVLLACARVQVRGNDIQAAHTGVQLGQESSNNQIQTNTILGVSSSGITLEPDTAGNTVRSNRVLCAAGARCQAVDATPAAAEGNRIARNQP